jgi:hypothetical protein
MRAAEETVKNDDQGAATRDLEGTVRKKAVTMTTMSTAMNDLRDEATERRPNANKNVVVADRQVPSTHLLATTTIT